MTTTGTCTPRFPKTAAKGCYRELFDVIKEKYLQSCLPGQLVCFADFVGKTLLADRFLLPQPNCLPGVCLATIFEAVSFFICQKHSLQLLAHDLIFTLLRIWNFMYSPIVTVSPALSLQKDKSSAAKEFFYRLKFCTQSRLCRSWDRVCEQCRKEILVCEVFFLSKLLQIWFKITSKIVSHFCTKEFKTWSYIFQTKINCFCFPETLTVIKLSLRICLSIHSVFIIPTMSVTEGWKHGSR